MVVLRRTLLVTVFALLASLGPGQDLDEQRAELARVDRAYIQAKIAFLQSPFIEERQKAFVDIAVLAGTVTMTCDALSPKEKYPEALRMYREALALDPENGEALRNKELIEGIYEQMGRPIPET